MIAKVSLKKKLIHITMEEICINLFEFSRCWKKASNLSKKFRLSSNGQAGRKKKSNFHNFLHGDINNPYKQTFSVRACARTRTRAGTAIFVQIGVEDFSETWVRVHA